MLHLARHGLRIVPVGGFEEGGMFCLRFGQAYKLGALSGCSARDRDRVAGQIVMQHIAAQLPERLRGRFAKEAENHR
jgi:hypothetical protein